MNLTLKIFGAEEDISLEIEYSQSGTYVPYKKKKYVTVRTKTAALDEEKQNKVADNFH